MALNATREAARYVVEAQHCENRLSLDFDNGFQRESRQ
jgi:hypothetical protein